MNLQKIFLAVLICIVSSIVCLGQNESEFVEGDNWVNQYGIYPTPFIVFRYDRYSSEDTVKFREKFDLLKETKLNDEWEGIYSKDNEDLGYSYFRWESNVGFAHLYIYTCFPEVRYMNYGKVVNTPEYIQTIPEFISDSPRKADIVKYVKVKWNNRRYLVEESSLPTFAEQAVGIYVLPAEDSEERQHAWVNYWVKGDLNQELTGAPEFPASYKKFQRQPIETVITSVGKRTIEKEVERGGIYYTDETAFYKVTIGVGANKGVKKRMIFYSPELNEELIIEEVNRNSAVGFIIRTLDEDLNEICTDADAEQIPCPVVKTSLKVKTRIGIFWL